MTRDEIKYLALQELGYNTEPDFNADDDHAVNAINKTNVTTIRRKQTYYYRWII